MKYLFTFLTLLPLFVFSQSKPQVTWSAPISVSRKKVRGPYLTGSYENYLYLTKSKIKNKSILLEVLDAATLALSQEIKVKMLYEGHPLKYQDDFSFNGKAAYISYYVNKRTDIATYIYHEISNGKVVNGVILAEVKDSKINSSWAEYNPWMRTASFSYVVSEDEKRLMVCYSHEVGKGEKPDVQTTLFNEDLKEVRRGRFLLENFAPEQVVLLSDGRLAGVGNEEIPGETKGIVKHEKIVEGDYGYFVYDGNGVEKRELKLDEKEITSIKLKEGKKGALLYGLYATAQRKGTSGAFIIKLDGDLDPSQTYTKDFGEEFIANFASAKLKKQNEKNEGKGKETVAPTLDHFVINDLVFKENGDMTLLTEQYYTYETSYASTNGSPGNTVYHYVYNDVIAVNFTADNEFSWTAILEKNQHSVNTGGFSSSFIAAAKGDAVYVIYNESQDDPGEGEKNNKVQRKVYAAAYILDESGNVRREKLYEREDEDKRRIIPGRCKDLTNGRVLIYTLNNMQSSAIVGMLVL